VQISIYFTDSEKKPVSGGKKLTEMTIFGKETGFRHNS